MFPESHPFSNQIKYTDEKWDNVNKGTQQFVKIAESVMHIVRERNKDIFEYCIYQMLSLTAKAARICKRTITSI